jgi:hypothetical protein
MTQLHNTAVVKCVHGCPKIILDAELVADVKLYFLLLHDELVADVKLGVFDW